MKEWHVTKTERSEFGYVRPKYWKWKIRGPQTITFTEFKNTQKDAWEIAKAKAKKSRGVAILHGRNGDIREMHNYRWEGDEQVTDNNQTDI